MGLFGKNKNKEQSGGTLPEPVVKEIGSDDAITAQSVDTASSDENTESDDFEDTKEDSVSEEAEDLEEESDDELEEESDDELEEDSEGGLDTEGEEESEGTGSFDGVTGEQILEALHKRDDVQQRVLSRVGDLSDKASDFTLANISEGFTEQMYGMRAKVIAFFGAGGGVGTSTMLLEIATRVSELHKRVLVIDLNVMGGICELMLHSEIKGKKEDLYTLLGKTSSLNRTVARSKSGIMTLGFRNRGMDAVASVDSAIYGSVYNELLSEMAEGYDFVFIDCGSNINYYLANNALYKADAGYIVTDGGLSSVQHLASLQVSFRYCGILLSGFSVISNKNTRSIKSTLSDMGYRSAGQVPYLLSMKNANLQGKLLGNDFIFSESAGVGGAKATLDAIAKEIVTPVVSPLKDEDRKQDMLFDKEAKEAESV